MEPMSVRTNAQTLRSIGVAAAVLVAAGMAAGQSSGAGLTPRIGVIHQHGLAGVVTSVSGPTIVIEIPENVSFTVQTSPSTRFTSAGQTVAFSEIHPRDPIFASGEVDEQARTIQAQEIAVQQPLAARMFENQRANFGRTWTAGVVTAVEGKSIAVARRDGQSQTISVDDGTVWRLNDRDASAAMLRAGERIRVQLRPAGPAARVTIQGIARESQSAQTPGTQLQ
jgi:hypothetical protein